MIILEKELELKYVNRSFYLPHDTRNTSEGYFLGLLIKSSTDAVTILDNKMVHRDNKYLRYFKPVLYKDKVYSHLIELKLTSSDITDMNSFARTMHLSFFSKGSVVKDKNILVDTSPLHSTFFDNCKGKNYLDICKSYVEHLTYYMNITCKDLHHKNRFLIINVSNWGISSSNKSKVVSANHKMLNPISIIYTLLKKSPNTLEKLNAYELIVLDNDNGWFRWNISNREHHVAEEIRKIFQKFKSTEIDIDMEPNMYEEENKKKEMAKNIAGKLNKDSEDENDESKEVTKDTNKNLLEEEGITEDDIEIAMKNLNDNYHEMSRSLPLNKRFEDLRKKQHSIRVHNVSMGDVMEGKIPDYHIEETDISDKVFTPNENVKKIRFDNFNKSYNEKVKTRDIMSVFSSMNNSTIPVVVKDIKVENTSDAMNLKETWHVKLESADGVQHSITVDIPLVYDNNYMYLSGNRKQFVNQDILLPLIKISPNKVQIITNYRKNFIERYGDILSPKVTIFKKIIANNPQYFSIQRGNAIALSKGNKTSIEYDAIAKDFVSITIKNKGIGLNFNQSIYKKMIEEKKLHEIDDIWIHCILDERKDAKIKAFPAHINAEAMSTEDDDSFEDKGVLDLFATVFKHETGKDFWSLAGDKEKAGKRFMYSRIKIMGKWIPCILLMSYYEGLTTVLRKANIKHEFSDKRKKISFNQGIIEFSDGYLIFDRNPTAASLLMNGLSLVDTKSYKYEEFDQTGIYLDIFDALYNSRALAPKLDAFYDNMIDPVTKEILQQMDLPTDYVGLMVAANELLADNEYQSEIDMRNFRIRNMEMIYVYLYEAVANAYSNYRRTAANRNPEKISIPKNAVIKEILTSNVCEDVSVINPITEKEKLHSNTNKGPVGINVDRAYTKEKRCFDKTMTGIMSVSTSPDGNCGVVREFTVEPKIVNARGFIDCEKPIDEMKDVNLFSYAEMLTSLGITNDDSIRTAMATKQSKHIIPVKDMSPNLISTGLEKQLPYAMSKDFVVRAKEDGVVKEIDPSAKIMILAYKDGTHEAVNLNPVVVKNGGGGFYLSNTLISLFKVGSKFKKNDIIAQNKDYFSKHYDGCKFNIGTLCKTAIMSAFCTYEDSKAITHKLSERLSTEMIMMKHLVLGPNATVVSMMKKGQHVKVGDELIKFEASNQEDAVNKLLSSIGDDLKEEIKSMSKNTLVSKYTGVIEDIRIYSTLPPENLSPSLAKVVKDYWEEITKKKKLVRKYKIDDPTLMGNTYYELDIPIRPDSSGKVKGYKLEEGVIIEFYIKFSDPAGVGDKLADYAALKGVCCYIFPQGEEPYTELHPEEEISTILPATSVLARKVPSILAVMFGNKCIIEMKRKLKEMYDKGKK